MPEARKRRTRYWVAFLPALVLIAGIAAVATLVAHYGFHVIGDALIAVGVMGFAAITGFHLGIVVLCGVAWFVLVPESHRSSAWPFILGRLVRNGGSEALPLSQFGGFVIGSRAATAAGVPGAMSFASTVVDITMELLGEIIYVALALGILLALRPRTGLETWVAAGLAAATLLAIAYGALQRRGFAILERIARTAPQGAGVAAGAASLQNCIDEIYRRFRGPLLSFLLHLFAWLAGAVEAWFALKLMGTSPGLAAVFSIEGLLCAARAIAFAVPGAFGVQEGAYVLLGGLYGVTPTSILALSLLKRARDLMLGVPPLLAWQFIEGRRLQQRESASVEAR
jgi:putative membrane protein